MDDIKGYYYYLPSYETLVLSFTRFAIQSGLLIEEKSKRKAARQAVLLRFSIDYAFFNAKDTLFVLLVASALFVMCDVLLVVKGSIQGFDEN